MRTPATNKCLAQWQSTWLIEHSTSHQLLRSIGNFLLRNSLLRQAQNVICYPMPTVRKQSEEK